MTTAAEQVFTPSVQLICPFCGGSATAGHLNDGTPAVFHTQPMCQQFEKIDDPADYLAAARRAYQNEGQG